MLKSMTGFARSESVTLESKITVELKSVNHRYCEMSIKMPKKLGFLETKIRNLLKEYVSRGKMDVFISYEDYTDSRECVKYKEEIAGQYVRVIEQMAERFGLSSGLTAERLSRRPEVLTLEEERVDEENVWNGLEKTVREAAELLVESRLREGVSLKKDIGKKLDSMIDRVDFIEQRSPDIVKEYREKLTAKVTELLNGTKLEEGILAAEITLFADKICVDEETVRLRSHIGNMKRTLEEEGSIGRKLDFIAQEMNREANTILSKSNDLQVSDCAIELKTEIEKVREQIQNIE